MAGSGTILIVDDEKNLRLTLAAILQRAGYTVTAVGYPQDALRCLESGPFDLAFLDLQLPDMDGLTLLGEIRRMYADMPVLILTAHATLKSSIEAVRMGARDYLLKPVDPPLILSRVEEILADNRRSERRREIMTQIQNLMAELQQMDGESASELLLSTLPGAAAVSSAATLPGGNVAVTNSRRFIQRGTLTLDLQARQAVLGEAVVALPPTAFDYLVTLARHAPDPVSFESLVSQSQGYTVDRREAQEIVRWRIHQLRQALEPDPDNPRYILTIRGTGYKLVV